MFNCFLHYLIVYVLCFISSFLFISPFVLLINEQLFYPSIPPPFPLPTPFPFFSPLLLFFLPPLPPIDITKTFLYRSIKPFRNKQIHSVFLNYLFKFNPTSIPHCISLCCNTHYNIIIFYLGLFTSERPTCIVTGYPVHPSDMLEINNSTANRRDWNAFVAKARICPWTGVPQNPIY